MDEVRRTRGEAAPSDDAHRRMERDHPRFEAQKSYHVVLEQQTIEAEEELDRPWLALLLSGLTAGLDLGFGPFAMAVGGSIAHEVLSEPVIHLLEANLYTIGFAFVVLGRSALFTERTMSAVLPVLARRATVARLLRAWGLVLVANVVGGILFSWAAAELGSSLDIIEPTVLKGMAQRLVDKPTGAVLLSAIAAGWLMGLLAWLLVAARDTISQLVLVYITTLVIGLGGLHHSIAGTVEILLAVFAGAGGASWADFGRFLLLSVPGNAVGGVVFVALIKFGSVQQSATSG